MMDISPQAGSLLILFSIVISAGQWRTHASSYDYTATTECLTEPWRAQYDGGILANPEFTHGVEGWTGFGLGAVKEGRSESGNRYIVLHGRTESVDSISQKVQLEKGKVYSFSAWVQVSEGRESVAVVFRTDRGEMIRGGRVMAKNGCWSLLKGGAFPNFTGLVDILFESKNTKAEIWIDNVSLQPFTMEQWRSHQAGSIDKGRKSKVSLQVTYSNGTAVEGATLSLKQTKSGFPFGCGMNYHILNSTDYQNWFSSRFNYATFTNEMKWYTTEKVRSVENYTLADAMLTFCRQNDISVRGHCIFWDDPKYQPSWVKNLTADELQEAAAKRIDSVVTRYSGQLIAWDVMNENLHFRFFEDKLGENASAKYFSRAYQLDPDTTMFMNEYNTIEDSDDESSYPVNYKNKLEDILSYPENQAIKAGIGLQGHFGLGQPNLAYMRSSLDILGSIGYPIWLTEVDVQKGPNQAEYFEQILREGYSHPAVEGIIIFAGPEIAGFNVTTLADKYFNVTEAGSVVDKLLEEWKSHTHEIVADGEGESSVEISLFHGDYDITITHPVTKSSTSVTYQVTKGVAGGTIHVHLNAESILTNLT